MPTSTKYRSKNGRHDFEFTFNDLGSRFEVLCSSHPPLNGRDSDPQKTHLFRSGRVCIVSGKEPLTRSRAQQLAAQWAEYFLEYRKTGKVQK